MPSVASIYTIEGENLDLVRNRITQNPALNEYGFTVVPFPRNLQLPIHTRLDKITKDKVACGSLVDTGTGIAITHRDLTYAELELYVKECADKFDNTILAAARKSGVQKANLDGTAINTLVTEIISDAAERDQLRILWLGDTGSSNTDYSQMDGIYKKVAASSATDVGALTSTEFTVANLPNTMNLFLDGRSERQKALPNSEQAFWVTGKVADAVRNWRQQNPYSDMARIEQIDGVDKMYWDGIEIVTLRYVDTYLNADFKTGTPPTLTTPYRIILGEKANFYVALDGDAMELETWYDPNTKYNNFRGLYAMDFQYAYDDMFVFGGF